MILDIILDNQWDGEKMVMETDYVIAIKGREDENTLQIDENGACIVTSNKKEDCDEKLKILLTEGGLII